MRTFLAFDITEGTRNALRAAQKLMGRLQGVRWTDPEAIHLTLKFIGEIEDSKIPDVFRVMKTAVEGIGPLEFSVRGLGWFPPGRRPRVIWAGVEGAVAEIQEVARRLDEKLGDLNVPRENRAFKSHLTIGRVNGRIDAAEVEHAFGRAAKREFGQELAVELVFYMSELLPSGACYTRMGAVPLEGQDKDKEGR
jgi:2'-5' RNA ligase